MGFISDLPTQLVAAFRATLEEVTAADVIVHVRDIANPATRAQKRQVETVLADLGVVDGEGSSSVPIVEVWNKWDLLSPDERETKLALIASQAVDVPAVPISAVTGEGVPQLLEKIGELLTGGARIHSFVVPTADGQRLAWLHAHGEVIEETSDADESGQPVQHLKVRLTPRELGRYIRL